MDKLFGYSMNGAGHDTPWGIIYAFSDKLLGEIFVTEAVVDEPDEIDLGMDNYKAIAVLREFHTKGRRIIVCRESQKVRLHQFRNGAVDPYTVGELLNLFPTGIKELQDRILLSMTRFSSVYGAEIQSFGMYDFFARDRDEMYFLMKTMIQNDLILANIHEAASGPVLFKDLQISEKGWIRIESLSKGLDSSQVFVAMWFDASMDEAFESIKKSCLDVNLSAFRIDRKQFNSEISGEILYEINRSRFMIADVTGQRPGVYFEAGYAMGKGKPVIWSCRTDEIEKVHFDTRQYNHVVWHDCDELYLKIRDRIRGTISAIEA
jgi:hypothetical protein